MSRIRSLPRADLALAGGLAAYAVVEAALMRAEPGYFLWGLAVTVPFAWRRQFPVAVIALVLAVLVVPGALGAGGTDSVLPLPVMVVIGYTIGRAASSSRNAVAGAVAVVAVVVAGNVMAPDSGNNSAAEDVVALVVIVGGAVLAGQLVRLRQGEAATLRQLSAQLAAEQEHRAQAAVAEERARVARELHDVIAHSVSLIAVQAAAADELLGRDEARARASIRAVQETARGALGEMRRLLSVLRVDDADDPGTAPQPGLDRVGDLVEQLRAGGLPVDLHEAGTRRPLPPGVELSAYRIVQEALTNVRRHAGAVRTDVLVEYGDREVVVEVANEAGRPQRHRDGGGYGLLGMRERARIFGGTLEAGAEGSRFVVRARLPVEVQPS